MLSELAESQKTCFLFPPPADLSCYTAILPLWFSAADTVHSPDNTDPAGSDYNTDSAGWDRNTGHPAAPGYSTDLFSVNQICTVKGNFYCTQPRPQDTLQKVTCAGNCADDSFFISYYFT